MKNTGYCFTGALERLGGDEELFQELMTFFVEDAPELLQAIHVGLRVGNARGVEHAAHTLRGLAANFDAEKAMNMAGSIEEMAGKGDLPRVVTLLAPLELEIHSLQDALKKCLSQSSSRRPAPQVHGLG